MTFTISRRTFAALVLPTLLAASSAIGADAPKQIAIDWATYNPVSMILKDKGLLEKEFARDNIKIVWMQSAGSNKALEFLNAGSIDFGSTAGAAALVAKINGNPIKSIYVYSRPEWTALVTNKDSAQVQLGEIAGIIGGSGCGKFTIDLTRSRDRTAPEFEAVKRRVLSALNRSLDRLHTLAAEGWMTVGEGI